MTQTRLVIHAPEHRRRSIAAESNPLAPQTYDHNVRAYFDFLRSEGGKAGIDVHVDVHESDAAIGLDGDASADRKRAHQWLAQQPDIWNWLPGADERGAPLRDLKN